MSIIQAFVVCCGKFYSTIRKADAKVKLLIKNMVDKKACVLQQWWGNTINSGLYLKKERLALSFKYFMSIPQPFQPSNRTLKYCAIIRKVQWLPSLNIYKLVTRVIQYFCFPNRPMKGGKGRGGYLERGMTLLTNYEM